MLTRVVNDKKAVDDSAAITAKANADKAAAVEAARLKKEADIRGLMTTKDNETDVNDLSPKEILEVVANAFDTAIEARTNIATTQFSAPMEELKNKIDGISNYLIRKEAMTGVDSARRKFNDFDTYKDEISETFKLYPGITPEDAYILVKGKKASVLPSKDELDSERPIDLATRAHNAEVNYNEIIAKNKASNNNTTSARGSFKDALASAAERIISSRKQ